MKYHFDILRVVAQFAYVFITLDQIRNAIMVHGDVNCNRLSKHKVSCLIWRDRKCILS